MVSANSIFVNHMFRFSSSKLQQLQIIFERTFNSLCGYTFASENETDMGIQITLRITNDRNALTLDKIAKCIHRKGMTCHRVSENAIEFEKDGSRYKMFLDGRRFQLGQVFGIDKGTPAQMLLMASNQFNLEGCGVKASINIDADNPGNNILVFSVDGFCHRPKDFEKDFDFSIEALKGGVERHRTICQKYSAETSSHPVRRKIGFIQSYE